MKRLIWATMVSLAMGASTASASLVGTELVLAVDVSGSVSASDFAIQRSGYEAAFRDPNLISVIQNGPTGSIAVTFAYWSSGGQYQQAVGWTLINDAASSNAFADAIASSVRPFSGGTNVGAAITESAGLFAGNGYDSNREVIDISGDGSSSPTAAAAARDAFLGGAAQGVDRVINAIWIEDPPFFFVGQGNTNPSSGFADPLIFGQSVIGGPDSFQVVVSSFDEFAPAVVDKISREVSQDPVPEPASVVLWTLLSGLGLFVARRRRQRA